MEQRKIIADKIETLTRSLAYSNKEDAYVLSNTIKRLKHKLNELDGVKNECDIDDDGTCLSCSG